MSIPLNIEKNINDFENSLTNVAIPIMDCLKSISVISYPTAFFYLCIFLQQTMILSFISKKYDDENMVTGIGISNLYCNCLYYYLAIGLISGCDTLCSNAYSLKKFYLFGLYVQRSRLVTFLIILTLGIFHYFFAIKLISLLIKDEYQINFTSRYITFNLIYGLLEIQFGINFRVLNIAGKSSVNMYILFVSISLHPLWCFIFINLMDLEVIGAGFALISSQIINTTLSTLYLHFFHPIPESSFSLNKDCFRGWWQYLRFAIPAAFLLLSEWLSFDIQGIFCLYMTKIDYEVYLLIFNVVNLIYSLIGGFSMATTILVGKFIANNTKENTRRMSLTCFFYGTCVIIIVLVPVFILQEKTLYIYTNNPKIFEKAASVINYMCLATIFDMSQSLLCSICRGLGEQIMPSILALVQFYFLQTILTWLFGIHYNYGVEGIFISSSIGCGLSTIGFIILILRFDLSKINLQTLKRIDEYESI